MPCNCGEVTCICFYVCACRPQLCLCEVCIAMRGPQDLIVEKPSKQSQDHNESPRKKSAHSDPSNEQMYSLASDSPPSQSRMEQSSASVFDPRKQTPGSIPETKPSKSSPIDDPYPTIRKHLSQPPRSLNFDPHPILRKRLSETAQLPNFDPHATFKRHLSQPAPPSNYDPHAILRRQLSQPAPPSNHHPRSILRRQLSQPANPDLDPSNQDPHANLKRRLSEPRRVPIGGDLSSELPPSGFHKNPSIGGSSPSVSIKDPYLPSTNKTGGSETPPTSGFNNEFNSVNSTNSRGKNVSTNPSCADLELIKKASDKASPSYESFSSRFSTLSCDENNNSGLTLPTFQNQNTRQTSTDLSGQCSEIHTPLYLETSGANSASCSNPESQFVHYPDRVPMQPSPQEHPLNLSLFSEDEHKNSFSNSLQHSSQSLSPVPAKQQRMDTTEVSNVPTGEGDNQSAESFREESSRIFSTGQILPSSDSTAEGYFPETRSESAVCMSGRSVYTSCIVQNPSQYVVRTQQEYPMDTDAFSRNVDQNLSSDSLSAPSTSGFFSPYPISNSSQASSQNMIYSNDLNDGRNFTLQETSSDLQNLEYVQSLQSASSDSNRFSENPYFEHEVFTTSCQQTSSTNRQSVIMYPSSQQPPQSSSAFSRCQTTNPVNISHPTQASSSTFSPSLNEGDIGYISSQTSNETTITSQNTNFPQSNVNMVSAFSTATSTESTQSYARGREHLSHPTQSSTLQSASSEIHPSQRTTRHRDDETGENN